MSDSNDSGCLFGAVVIVGLLVWGGATLYNNANPPAKRPIPAAVALPPPVAACTTDHRSEKMEIYPYALRADIALDSCTGQVCRTWSWAIKGTTRSAWSEYENAPLCSDLATQR